MKNLIVLSLILACGFSAYAKENKASNNEPALVYSKAKSVRFRNHVDANTGSFFKFMDVPKKYAGRLITLHDKESNDPLKFKVKKAGVVSLVTLGSVSTKLVGENWAVVGKARVENNNGKGFNINILEKFLDEGEHSIDAGIGTPFGVRLLK